MERGKKEDKNQMAKPPSTTVEPKNKNSVKQSFKQAGWEPSSPKKQTSASVLTKFKLFGRRTPKRVKCVCSGK